MSDVKPIPTRYKGYHFRSRTEARWAVFFDHLNVPWEYEPQGYDLGDGVKYLPDFLLYPKAKQPKMRCWFEVKGEYPTPEELDKANRLAKGTDITTFVYFGEMGLPAPDLAHVRTFLDFAEGTMGWIWDDRRGWVRESFGPAAWEIGLPPTAFRFDPHVDRRLRSGLWWWAECFDCGKALLRFKGQVGGCPLRDPGDEPDVDAEPEPLAPRFGHATERMKAAYAAARSARFEHGQSGAT